MQFLCSSPPWCFDLQFDWKNMKKDRPAKNENVSAQIRASFAQALASFAQEPRKLQLQSWPRNTSLLHFSPAPSRFKQRDHARTQDECPSRFRLWGKQHGKVLPAGCGNSRMYNV